MGAEAAALRYLFLAQREAARVSGLDNELNAVAQLLGAEAAVTMMLVVVAH